MGAGLGTGGLKVIDRLQLVIDTYQKCRQEYETITAEHALLRERKVALDARIKRLDVEASKLAEECGFALPPTQSEIATESTFPTSQDMKLKSTVSLWPIRMKP